MINIVNDVMNIINFKIFLFLNNLFLDIIGLPVNNEVVSDIVCLSMCYVFVVGRVQYGIQAYELIYLFKCLVFIYQ